MLRLGISWSRQSPADLDSHQERMEALQTAISYWEDALESYVSRGAAAGAAGDAPPPARPLAVTTAEEAEFSRELHNLLDSAYKLQDDCEVLFLDQRSVLFRDDSSAVREWVAGSGRAAGSSATGGASRRGHLSRGDSDRRTNITGASSSPDSFASAQDVVADLREFEAFAEVFTDYDNFPLYQTALKQLENGGIPYRCLRTEAVNCVTNVEYLGKLYCIRLGFQYLFRQSSTWVWFADTGQQILTDLLLFADKDPKDFLIAYEDMLSFLQSLGGRDGPRANFRNSADSKDVEDRTSSQQYSNTTTWADVEEELATRGVKAMTFFDVVLDYILLDAFEDLDDPPSSVTAVVQNRWLSSGFKETALATAVWSLLKAKRHRLNQPNGFMAHFYAISEHISPLMAWGFLGTDEELRSICQFFKDQVMGFLQDIFNFQQTRYTSVEELALDVMGHARSRADGIMERLSAPVEPTVIDTTLTASPQLLADLASQSSIGISDGKI
ncbi:mitoguardin-like [Hetaerina americana]|uniref:mitoguardin-like n=1 Tax=Hetaerina americana TaxID=62018 RepID=UPI003A7F4B32